LHRLDFSVSFNRTCAVYAYWLELKLHQNKDLIRLRLMKDKDNEPNMAKPKRERGIKRCSHWRCGRPSSEASDEIASRVCCSASAFTFPTLWCVGEARGRLATRVESLVLAAATPTRRSSWLPQPQLVQPGAHGASRLAPELGRERRRG
jgi:hypothetical protein